MWKSVEVEIIIKSKKSPGDALQGRRATEVTKGGNGDEEEVEEEEEI